MSNVVRDDERGAARLEYIADGFKGSVSREIGENEQSPRNYGIRKEREEKPWRPTSVIDRTSTLPIRRAEKAEHLLAEKVAVLLGESLTGSCEQLTKLATQLSGSYSWNRHSEASDARSNVF